MLLPMNITPIQTNSNNCLEDILVSYTAWKGRKHALMYAKSWDFSYQPLTDRPDAVLGERIFEAGDHCFWCIERYHGIKVEWAEEIPKREMIRNMASEISSSRPVIINMDAFWIPWSKTYRLQHTNHFVLAVGIDENDFTIKCIDPFLSREENLIPWKDFAYSDARCLYLSETGEDLENIQWQEVLETSVQWAKRTKENGSNSFKDIRLFAEEAADSLDIKRELHGFPLESMVPIYFRLYMIGASRLKFSKMLDFLAVRYGVSKLVPFVKEFEGLMWEWYEIKDALIRAGRSDHADMRALRKSVSQKLREIADREERAAGMLL